MYPRFHPFLFSSLAAFSACATPPTPTPAPAPAQADEQERVVDAAAPGDPFASCQPGLETAEGVVLDCHELRVVWGRAGGGVTREVDAVLSERFGEDYASKIEPLIVDGQSWPGLRYIYSERVGARAKSQRVEVAGMYHVIEDHAGVERALHCAGAPARVEAACVQVMTELVRGGVPAHLVPATFRPAGLGDVIPMIAGEVVVVPKGCASAKQSIECGDVWMRWEVIDELAEPDFEEMFVRLVAGGLERELGARVAVRRRDCELRGRHATCERLSARNGEGRHEVIAAYGAIDGRRVVVLCGWGGGKKIPGLCAGSIR